MISNQNLQHQINSNLKEQIECRIHILKIFMMKKTHNHYLKEEFFTILLKIRFR